MADTSYAVYLFHGVFLSLLGGRLAASGWFLERAPMERVAVLFVAVGLCSYAFAWVLHRAVERPFIHLGRQVGDRLFPVERRRAAPVA
ncbi:MAG TPA: hypothetical protein VNO52_11440 [Methylomirabilota bacterium]|nr:hypothetical protein [Methylomirabilota bacterium]